MRRKIKRRKKKALGNKSIICITTVMMLNAMGVSYGIWNDGHKMSTKLFTGNMSVGFTKVEDITEKSGQYTYCNITKYKNENGDLIKEEITEVVTVDIQDELEGKIDNDGENITISGSVIDKDGSNHTVKVKVKNYGTIPIKLKEVTKGSWSGDKKIEPKDEAIIEIRDVFIEPNTNNKRIILKFEQSI